MTAAAAVTNKVDSAANRVDPAQGEDPAKKVEPKKPADAAPSGGTTDSQTVDKDKKATAPAAVDTPTPVIQTPTPVDRTSVDMPGLSEGERANVSAIRDQPSFKGLPEGVRADVSRTLLRRPEAIAALREMVSQPEFGRMTPDQQRDVYQLVVTGGMRSAAAVVGATTPRLEPAEITTIFPGQRAGAGGGELSETMHRAEQMRKLFPNARHNVLVFDPPTTIDHESTTNVVNRQHRLTTYMHQQLGWNEPWDYTKQPVIERNGMRFIYATAPQEGDFRERYQYRDFDPNTGRPVLTDASALHPPRAQSIHPTADSLAAQVLARSDLAVVAGAGSTRDRRTWNLGTDGGPRARVNVNFFEPDVLRLPTDSAVPVIPVTRSGDRNAIPDLSSDLVNRMNAFRETYADPAARAALLRDVGMTPDVADRVAREGFGVGYAHRDVDAVRSWRAALEASSTANGRPFSAVAVLPGHSSTFPVFLQAFGLPTTIQPPVAGGGPVRAALPNGNELFFINKQPGDTFHRLVAGSSQPVLMTGANSIADALAARQPFVYETLGPTNQPKADALRAAAPDILRSAGFSQTDIAAFTAALPTNGTHDFDRVRALFSDPERARRMYDAVSREVARENPQAIRDRLLDLTQFPLRGGVPTQVRAGLGSWGAGVLGMTAAHGVTNALGLEGLQALPVDLAVGTGIQTAAELAMRPPGADPFTARTFASSALRAFPGALFQGGLAGAALKEMGVDPNSFVFNAGVIGGQVGMQYGGQALHSYAALANRAGWLGTVKWAGRIGNAAGIAMAADFVGGLGWNARATDADYQRQVGLVAARLANPDAGPALEFAGQFVPNAVAAAGLQTDEANRARAAALIRAQAEGAELFTFQRIAGALQRSNGGLGDTTYEDVRDAFFGPGAHAVDAMRIAAGRNRTGFESQLLANPPRSQSREDIAAWVRDTLPRIASGELERTEGDIARGIIRSQLHKYRTDGLYSTPEQAAGATRMWLSGRENLMRRAGWTESDIQRVATEMQSDPAADSELTKQLLQRSLVRATSLAYLTERPGSLPTQSLGAVDREWGRRLVGEMRRGDDQETPGRIADDLVRRNGVQHFFAEAGPLGEGTAHRIAREVLARDFQASPTGLNQEQSERAARLIATLSQTFGPNAPVTRSVATELGRRLIQGIGEGNVARFIAHASLSDDPSVMAGLTLAATTGQWRQRPGWSLQATVSEYWRAWRAPNTWDALPADLRGNL